MLRRATAEDVNLPLALDDFTIATNWLDRRSDLHNTISTKYTLACPLFQHPLSMTRTRVHNNGESNQEQLVSMSLHASFRLFLGKRSYEQSPEERQILHIFVAFTTPRPRNTRHESAKANLPPQDLSHSLTGWR